MEQTSALLPEIREPISATMEDKRYQRRLLTNKLMTGLLAFAAFSAVAVLFAILATLIANGIGAIMPDLFTKEVIDKGLANSITGTLLMALVAALMAVPVGILTAIYLSEYSHGPFASIVRWTLDLLAQMPSIVIGLFVWSLLIVTGITGYSGIAGSIALAIIMLPIIGRTTEEVLRLVPDTLREGALALGTPRWRVVFGVVIPTVFPGLVTGVVLSMARAAGETAPLLLTALGTSYFESRLSQPMDAIPTRLYRLALYSNDEIAHQQAWAAGLILVVVIAIFSALVRLITRRTNHES